ncbi:MAG: PAS domain S-box protein [Pseudomonadota bacterium]
MDRRPTYEELKQRVEELGLEAEGYREVELKKSEHEKGDILDTITEHVIYHDTDQRVLWANRAAGESVGATPEELIGRHCYEIWHQRAEPCEDCPVIEAIRTGRPHEREGTRLDGRIFFMRGYPFRDANGEIIGGVEVTEEITERKLAEAALRESKERYRGLFDNSTDFFFTLDLEGNFTDVNKAAERLTGFTKEELIGMNFRDYTPEDTHEKIFEAFHRLFEEGKALQDFPLEVTVKDSIKKYFETSTTTLRKGEKIIGFQGVSRDITKRVHYEEALKQSEDKYRTILESIEEGYYEVDLAGNFTFFNDSLCKILGYSDDEIVGMNYKEYTDEETANKIYGVFNKVFRRGKSATGFDWPLTCKDGGKRYVEISVSLMTDSEGQATGFRGIVRDVTEKKKTEAELIQTKNLLQNILNSSTDAISATDLKGNIILPSAKSVELLGYDSNELIGSKIYDRYENGIEDARRIMKELMEKGELRDYEMKLKRKDGRLLEVSVSASLLKNEYKETIGTLGIYRNISEKKRLEAQLQQAKKMEAIATLAGGIAHQFNNALTSITGYAGLLEMDFLKNEKVMKYVQAMKASAHRMAHLTGQLLAYARGGKYNPQALSLTDFIEDTLPLIQHTIKPDIRVETDLPVETWSVEADGTQMQMVLSAIVANSNEAIEGPGRIRISTRNLEVNQRQLSGHPGARPGPYVCLSIQDDGKGMDEQTKSRIFEPFFTTHFIGRGLGMASVYGIINNHGGWIEVDSESEKGTEVRIYLPVIEPEAEAEVQEGTVPGAGIELSGGQRNVLVIEDEEDVMTITREALERFGYRVLEAKTGSEAVEIARTFDGNIDLALLDIKLPDMSGGKVYPLIMEARPKLRVIVCSGYAIDGPAQEILDAGAEGFIQKPFLVSTLAEKLKEV